MRIYYFLKSLCMFLKVIMNISFKHNDILILQSSKIVQQLKYGQIWRPFESNFIVVRVSVLQIEADKAYLLYNETTGLL